MEDIVKDVSSPLQFILVVIVGLTTSLKLEYTVVRYLL